MVLIQYSTTDLRNKRISLLAALNHPFIPLICCTKVKVLSVSKIDQLGVDVLNGAYPDAIQTRLSALEGLSNRLKASFRFNPLILSASRRRFLNALARQCQVIDSLDKARWNSTLLETRHQLMRYGFRPDLVGRVFVLQVRIWGQNLSDPVAWAAFLMLRGCAVESAEDVDGAMLLCVCTLALIGVPVHWLVSDERRVMALAKKQGPFFQALGIASPVTFGEKEVEEYEFGGNGILIVTVERLAQIYLQDKWVLGDKRGRLGLLLQKLGGKASPFSQLQMPGLCFALIENLDFWLMEKAFSIVDVEKGKQQITLYELFCRYQRCAGSLLGSASLNTVLWENYQVAPVVLSRKNTVGKRSRVDFFQTLEQKWRAIAERLVSASQSGEKTCLIVTSSESLEQLSLMTLDLGLPVVMVKAMQGEVADEFERGSLIVLGEPFPWLGLEAWLNNSGCQLLIADFCDSLRVLQHLERIMAHSPGLSVKLFFSLEDKGLQQYESLSVYDWIRQVLVWRETLCGRLSRWLLRRLLTQVEARRRRLHGETSRWLWQRERMYSFSRKSDEAK